MLCLQNKPDFFIEIFRILCENNNTDTIDKIINYGIDMNTKDEHRFTPFQLACQYSPEISKIIINKNVQLDTIDIFGQTPFHVACIYSPEIAKFLIHRNIPFDTEDEDVYTPFSSACMYSPEIAKEMAKILIHKKIPFDTTNRFGDKVIDCCEKNSEIYNILIKAGAKP